MDAKVTSIEAVEAFRAGLVGYLEKAGRALDEVAEEVRRTRSWVESDRLVFWEKEVRRRKQALEQREQESWAARMSPLRQDGSGRLAEVRKARQAMRDAEEKLAATRRWARQFSNLVDSPAREIDSLREMLRQEMKEGAAFLGRIVGALDDYAELARRTAARPVAAAEGDGAEGGAGEAPSA